MTAALTRAPLQLVIFDCDGVLVDSEALSAKVVADAITRLGWAMTPAESMARFIGRRMADIPPVIEANHGRPDLEGWPESWIEDVRGRMMAAFETVQTIPGAQDILQVLVGLGVPFRVASNSSHEEMAVKFARTGLAPLVAGRQHSARDVLRGKPAPDVFLAAAAAEGVAPASCVVIEDSLPGIAGALAAGMAVIGLETHGNAEALRAAGARVITSLAELRPIVAKALSRAA